MWTILLNTHSQPLRDYKNYAHEDEVVRTKLSSDFGILDFKNSFGPLVSWSP